MVKQVLSIIALVSCLVTLAVAGSQSSGRFRVELPFDSIAGETKLKAGSYIVDSSIVRDVPLIRSADYRTNVFVMTFGGNSSGNPSRAKLVFRRYGDKYFLTQIWNEGSTVAMELPESRAEREVKKELKRLARAVQHETITVVAS